MRFIIQDDVHEHLPANWEALVDKAKAYVERKVSEAKAAAVGAGKTPEEIEQIALKARHKAINRKASVWRAAEDALRIASNGKCWYCESYQDRSDKNIDHFRPKNRVNEAPPEHPGYWWLAFDWTNFRYSCTYCNSKRRDLDGGTEGGKQDHFPIIPPPPHALSNADPQEQPKLLDPINDDDTKLLTFLPNGFPHPNTDEETSVDRVDTSVQLYHLDHAALVLRRKRLAINISQHVTNGNLAHEVGDDVNYKFHKKELIKLVRAQAEYSSAARIYLKAFRTHPWVEEILSRDL